MSPQQSTIEKPPGASNRWSALFTRRKSQETPAATPPATPYPENLHKQLIPLTTANYRKVIEDAGKDVVVEFYEDNVCAITQPSSNM